MPLFNLLSLSRILFSDLFTLFGDCRQKRRVEKDSQPRTVDPLSNLEFKHKAISLFTTAKKMRCAGELTCCATSGNTMRPVELLCCSSQRFADLFSFVQFLWEVKPSRILCQVPFSSALHAMQDF